MTTVPLWKRPLDGLERAAAARADTIIATDRFPDMLTGLVGALPAFARAADPGRALDGAVRSVAGATERHLSRSRNAVRLLGRLDEPTLGATPRQEIWARGRVRLLQMDPNRKSTGPPVVVVPSLVSTSDVFDLQSRTSIVAALLRAGLDIHLLDWGTPGPEDAGCDLAAHVDLATEAIDAVRQRAGVEAVDVVSHCLGGVVALLHAAAHPATVHTLTLMASPIDWSELGPIARMTRAGAVATEDLFDDTGNVPAAAVKNAFRTLQPTAQLAGWTALLQHLDNDTFVEHYRAVDQWAQHHVPFPGACFADVRRVLATDNSLRTGTVHLGDRTYDTRRISAPTLCMTCTNDHIVPPSAAALPPLGTKEVERVEIRAGHVGLLIGGSALKHTVPRLVTWLQQHHSDSIGAAD